jgi:uncharacterized protein YndB with AHSA1/START domain
MNDSSFDVSKSVSINAPIPKVWEALTNPELIKEYMFGAKVVTDWKIGSPITYNGEWQGQSYQDKGVILEIEPQKVLKTTYYSALTGLEDKPENYNIVTYQLSDESDGKTKLTVTQTNNPSQEAAAKAEASWSMILSALKEAVEK